jgi:hypothetical protein
MMTTASELDALLVELSRRRFRLYQFRGDHHGPDVFAAVYDWTTDLSDVLILRSEQDASAFRALTGPGIDVFNPPHVLWWYTANAVWTLRSLFTLSPPADTDAPGAILDLPSGKGLPTSARMPARVRVPGH